MKVLITNNTLSDRAGTELYVRDIAIMLAGRGHEIALFSTILGPVATDLQAFGVPVTSDIRYVPWTPDVIHGHHHVETMVAMTRFPYTPALFICHGWSPWQETPPKFPRILKYLAVDGPSLDRLQLENGIKEWQTDLFLNFVDTDRFHRRSPLPAKPLSALIFSNTAGAQVEPIKSACQAAGMKVSLLGRGTGNETNEPETVLGNYDMVFAIARSAIEAMASGCAVIVCDNAGLGELVTVSNYERVRINNFGLRSLSNPLTVEDIAEQLRRYDPADAGHVCEMVRTRCSLSKAIDTLEDHYFGIVSRKTGSNISQYEGIEEESLALAHYLQNSCGRLEQQQDACAVVEREIAALTKEAQSKRLTALNLLLEKSVSKAMRNDNMKYFARRLGPLARKLATSGESKDN